MQDLEKIIKWLEYDYLPRVGAYRKDCKQGCDACMPMHDGDDYCDIDMLWKVLALLKDQPEIVRCKDCAKWDKSTMEHYEDVFSGSGDTAECRMFCDMDSWGEFTDGMRRTDGNWYCADGKRKET